MHPSAGVRHTLLQHFSHPGFVDVMRAVRLGAYGFLIDGPVGSIWYDVLEKYVWPGEPSSTKAVLAKTALDQVVYATIMTGEQFAWWVTPGSGRWQGDLWFVASVKCSQCFRRGVSWAASTQPRGCQYGQYVSAGSRAGA